MIKRLLKSRPKSIGNPRFGRATNAAALLLASSVLIFGGSVFIAFNSGQNSNEQTAQQALRARQTAIQLRGVVLSNRALISRNRALISSICGMNFAQDRRLAVLVRASRKNPAHPPSTIRAFDAFLRGVKRGHCPQSP